MAALLWSLKVAVALLRMCLLHGVVNSRLQLRFAPPDPVRARLSANPDTQSTAHDAAYGQQGCYITSPTCFQVRAARQNAAGS
jgi:hypothetical protein